MVAYVLPAQTNGAAIKDGRRYALIAAPRRTDKRNSHASPGAAIHLSTAHTREHPVKRYFNMGRCVYSALVSFSADGVVRVLDAELPRSNDPGASIGEGLSNLLANAEQGSARDRTAPADTVARACGFDDYAALWASIRSHDGEVVARQIIAWGPAE